MPTDLGFWAPLADLRLGRYRLTYRVMSPLALPAFAGSAFRSRFGAALRAIACLHPERTCATCESRGRCAYGYVFDTGIPEGADRLRTHQDVPRPFVLEPPLPRQAADLLRSRRLEPGDRLVFHVVVFGRALEHVVDLLTAFHEVRWLGTRNGHVSLTDFASVQRCERSQARVSEPAQVVWSLSSRGYRRPRWTTAGEVMSRAGGDTLEVEFLTPTRLKHEATPVETPEFHILFRNLLRRVSNLAYLHEGIDLKLDFAGLIQAARSVDLAVRDTTWIDWERLSRRQDRLMTLGGFVGPVRYRGDLSPFLPLLALGEYTHVGKNATFGLGQYRLGSGATPAGR